MSDVCGDLAYANQELEAVHPFIETEACFAGKVVHMLDESFTEKLEPWVRRSRVDEFDIVGDVVNRQIL